MPSDRSLSPENLYSRNVFGDLDTKPRIYTQDAFLKRYGVVRDEIASVAKKNGATVIDPLDSLSVDGRCLAENEDGPIYKDEGHLRRSYISKHISFLDDTVAP